MALHMSEAQLRGQVAAEALKYGLAVQYNPDSRQCWLPGWPDLEIIGSRILYRELKTQGESATPAQLAVAERIMRAGGDWAVWRPSDLLDGTIAAQLFSIE